MHPGQRNYGQKNAALPSAQRNYGWGKRLSYAGVMGLKSVARKHGGRHAWYATNKSRWAIFCAYVTSQGIIDARKVTPEVIKHYAETLADKKVSTQQNYLSAVNTVMCIMAGNEWQVVSPKALVGSSRCAVRRSPVDMDEQRILEIANTLKRQGYIRESFVPLLAYRLGLRRKEAALLDVRIAYSEASKQGHVDVTRGTKGGRGRAVARLVPANREVLQLLKAIADFLPATDRCLVPADTRYQKFSLSLSNIVLPALKSQGITRLHDLRAAYACKRYQSITRCPAPCNRKPGDALADKSTDCQARTRISQELGHDRIQIANSYVGQYPSIQGAANA